MAKAARCRLIRSFPRSIPRWCLVHRQNNASRVRSNSSGAGLFSSLVPRLRLFRPLTDPMGVRYMRTQTRLHVRIVMTNFEETKHSCTLASAKIKPNCVPSLRHAHYAHVRVVVFGQSGRILPFLAAVTWHSEGRPSRLHSRRYEMCVRKRARATESGRRQAAH